MLTTGTDTFTGTSGNDTFNAEVAVVINPANGVASNVETAQNVDTLNGGAGIDTLNLTAKGGAVTLPSLTSVEVINAGSLGALTIDTSTVSDVTNLNVTKAAGAIKATGAATTDVSVTTKAVAADLEVLGGKDVTVKVTDVAANTNKIAVGDLVAGSGVNAPKGNVVVEATAKAADTVGTNITMGDIAVTGGKTISVTQKAGANSLVADGAAGGGTTTTHTQGGVTVVANSDTTTVTLKQDAAATAENVKAVTKVDEVATVTFTKLDANQTVTVGGLTFTASKDLTAEQVAKAFANLSASAVNPTGGATNVDTNGGDARADGFFTGALLAKWSSAAASGNTVTFTASGAMGTDLAVSGTGATVVTTTQGVDAVTGKNTLGVANGVVAITGGAALKTVTVDGYTTTATKGTDGIIGTTNTVLDTINLANGGSFVIESAAAALALDLKNVNGTVDVDAGTKTLNVSVSHAKATDTATLASNTAESVTVTGTGNVAGTTGAGANQLDAATSINTTGMTAGKATFTIADGTKTTYTGGAAVDSVTISNADTAITKAVDLGAGDDKLTLNGAGNVNSALTATLKGGEGTDTISMSGASAEALSANNTFAGKIEGFEKLEVTAIAGAQTDTVNLSNMDDINYVIYAGSTASAPTQEVQTFSVTNGVTATKTNEVQTIDFTGESITTVGGGTLVVGGVTIDTIADGDDAAAIASKVAAKLNGSTALTGAGGFAVVATALGTGVTITYDTQSGDMAPIVIADTTGASSDLSNATVATATAFAANDVTVTAGGLNVTLTAQDKAATGSVVAGSGDDTVGEVAGKIVTVLDGNATYVAADTANTGGDVTVKYAANADVGNIALVAAGGVAFSAVTEATKGSAGGTLGNLTLTNMANNGTLEMAASAAGATTTVTMKDATGSADSLNLVTKVAGDLDFGTVDVAGVETLKLNAVDTTPGTAAAPTINTATLDVKADKATSLTIEGNSNVTLTLDAATTKLATIDAGSLTGKLDFANTLKAVAMTITGGSGADVLKASVGSDAKADVIKGGLGNDKITAGSNGATLTGGDGNDWFILTASDATTGNKESNTYSTVTDFQAGDLLQLQFFNGSGGVVNGTADGATGNVAKFAKLAANLNDSTAVFSDFVNAAIKEAGIGEAVYFNFKGDAYVVVDSNVNSGSDVFINGQDLIVKLTGVNGDNLSFNSDYGTVALI